MLYTLLKRLIENNNYGKEDMQNKLDIFFAKDRITEEQYSELSDMINVPTE